MRRLERRTRDLAIVLAVMALSLAHSGGASAYIGPSYIKVPGVPGATKPEPFKGWVRAESNYWTRTPVLPEIRGISAHKNDLLFTGPVAPKKGPEMLAISVDKASPDFKPLMDQCQSGAQIPELTFAESSELARHPQEHGPRPADIPEYYEYRLKGVRLACPNVASAPEQAFEISFDEIQWLNYQPQPKPREITSTPAKLAHVTTSGTSKVFVVSWFAAAVDGRDDQCPKVNTKSSDADYYALLSKGQADEERSRYTDKGGVPTGQLQFRGPDHMNVCLMPGIVADPGHISPKSDLIRGFNLDSDDGSGAPPPTTRKHTNFTSPDGRQGIDNQLFTIEGCVNGFRRNGFLPMIFNEGRQVGRPTALLEISGIDNERNDDDVTVTILYSTDDFTRTASKVVIPDVTYRVSQNPQYTQDFARFHGKIVDGVLTTEPIDKLHIHEVTAIETTIYQPRMRIEFMPDGKVKGVIGGYLDWRRRVVWQNYRTSDYENTIGFQCPAIYNAMKRAADGLKDPVTGEFNGISAAFDIEGVPAFIPPEQHQKLLAESTLPQARQR